MARANAVALWSAVARARSSATTASDSGGGVSVIASSAACSGAHRVVYRRKRPPRHLVGCRRHELLDHRDERGQPVGIGPGDRAEAGGRQPDEVGGDLVRLAQHRSGWSRGTGRRSGGLRRSTQEGNHGRPPAATTASATSSHGHHDEPPSSLTVAGAVVTGPGAGVADGRVVGAAVGATGASAGTVMAGRRVASGIVGVGRDIAENAIPNAGPEAQPAATSTTTATGSTHRTKRHGMAPIIADRHGLRRTSQVVAGFIPRFGEARVGACHVCRRRASRRVCRRSTSARRA